jgi:hypothetical protein
LSNSFVYVLEGIFITFPRGTIFYAERIQTNPLSYSLKWRLEHIGNSGTNKESVGGLTQFACKEPFRAFPGGKIGRPNDALWKRQSRHLSLTYPTYTYKDIYSCGRLYIAERWVWVNDVEKYSIIEDEGRRKHKVY